MMARPVPGRPAPGGGLAVLVVVTVLAVLAAPELGRLRPLVDQLRQAKLPSVLPQLPKQAGGGAGGGICPVKGPVQFGRGWGAPRDGGRRRHQGIDLLAPAGTPLVAVASGRIIRLSNLDRGRGWDQPVAARRSWHRLTTTPTTSTTWSASASRSRRGSC
jgi:murein DD-endopeptidase MepM/ murein hydrolase activator NlpD